MCSHVLTRFGVRWRHLVFAGVFVLCHDVFELRPKSFDLTELITDLWRSLAMKLVMSLRSATYGDDSLEASVELIDILQHVLEILTRCQHRHSIEEANTLTNATSWTSAWRCRSKYVRSGARSFALSLVCAALDML